MEHSSTNSNQRVFFKQAFQDYFAFSLSFLLLLAGVRIFEYFYLSGLHQLPANSLNLEASGLWFDFLSFLKLSALLLIPFLLLSILSIRAARIFYGLAVCLLLLGYLGLIKYFSVSLVPLGSDLFGYTFAEIKHTVSISNDTSWLSLAPVLILVIVLSLLFQLFSRLVYTRQILLVFSGLLVFSFFVSAVPKANAYNSDFEFYLVNNKLGYFLTKSYQYLEQSDEEEENHTAYYLEENNSTDFAFTFLDKSYPFLHTVPNHDVLGNFFNLNPTQKPNLVFLVLESLGRAYSGDKAYLGSFTPFLDSLGQHSLYFENFLSTSGRTFGVLPGLFGALPFAEKGFLERGTNVPAHLTLFSLLKAQNYQIGFYYGGNGHFDNMDVFLRQQDIDFILDEKNFGPGYQKLPSKQNGFSWGYGDKEIFRKALSLMGNAPANQPRLDVFLTMASHDPFLIPDQTAYLQRVEKRFNVLNLNESQKQEYRKYKLQYSSLLYLDDAVQEFMQAYRSRPEYANTIFIITGDHRMPEIPVSTKIDRFHVPFLIYSPMLKKTAKISSVSSHFDVVPSVLALLAKSYNLKMPSAAAWLGAGLDTVRDFRNVHTLPIMRNKNELLDYLDKDYFLADGELFELQPNLNIRPVPDVEKERELTDKFTEFRIRNKYTFQHKNLLPDSLLHYKRSAKNKLAGK